MIEEYVHAPLCQKIKGNFEHVLLKAKKMGKYE